jgi:Transposase
MARPPPQQARPFKPHLQQRFQQGCTNAAALHREITAQGCAGSCGLVRDYLEQYRRAPDPIAPAPPTVREVTGWLTHLRGQQLLAWIAAVRAEGLPGLTAFADSLTSDLDAVTRGLTTHWSSGPIEGRVNHIKTVSSSRGRRSPRLSRNRT